MNWLDSEAEAALRARLRTWLAQHTPSGPAPRGGSERAAYWQAWHRALYAGGWMGLSWPEEYGGHGLGVGAEAILNDEVGRAGAPPVPHVGYIGRAILSYATPDQARLYLPPLLAGEKLWCQGFSEPGAGSDLAGLHTRAGRSGDTFTVSGQKVWTSDAAWADFCLLLARTDPESSRHRGISAFVVPMSSPGIEVRPIVQANGDCEFNEVFFDGVEVPAANLIGAEGQGWALAMSTLAFERGPVDIGFSSRYGRLLRELEAEARETGCSTGTRAILAEAYVNTEVLRLHMLRSLSRRGQGEPPGPEGSMDKLLATRTEQHLHHAALRLRGAAALTGDPGTLEDYLYSRAASIAGGTSQIQRTIVAERVLGLPRGA